MKNWKIKGTVLAGIVALVLVAGGVGAANASAATPAASSTTHVAMQAPLKAATVAPPVSDGGLQPDGSYIDCTRNDDVAGLLHVKYSPNNGTHGCPAGWTKDQYYGKAQVDTLINGLQANVTALQSAITHLQPAKVPAVGNTSVSGRDDSGHHGVWATDAFLVGATVLQHGAVAVSNCGSGALACNLYTASLMYQGSFRTNDGAHSPNAGVAIAGNVSGTMTGAVKVEFYASAAADGSLVPAILTGNLPTTSNWVKQFYPASAVISDPNIIAYSFIYSAPNTCELWTDANTNADGTAAGAGDIQGINACS